MNEYILQLQALSDEAKTLAELLKESQDKHLPLLSLQELFNFRIRLETLNRRRTNALHPTQT